MGRRIVRIGVFYKSNVWYYKITATPPPPPPPRKNNNLEFLLSHIWLSVLVFCQHNDFCKDFVISYGDSIVYHNSVVYQNFLFRLFSHESKVRNLNYRLNCAFWMIIWKTVFWTVCTPNYIAMRHLKCAFQMTVRRCFLVTHLANHAAKSPYECPDF